MWKLFVIIKPDAVARGLGTTILREIELLENVELATYKVDFLRRAAVEALYDEHRHQHFFNDLIQYMVSGPAGIATLTGGQMNRENVDAIRKRYGLDFRKNSLHASRTLGDEIRESQCFL